MSRFDVVVLDRLSSTRPRAAVAAARAGGVGLLDLEFSTRPDGPALAERHLRWLADRATRPASIGLRLAPEALSRFAGALDAITGAQAVVVLAGRPDARALAAARRVAHTLLVEVRSAEDLAAALSLGVPLDGVIACGNEAGGKVGGETTFVLLQRLLRDAGLPVYARGGIGVAGAAGCRAAGARGVVLDDQLLLLAESPLAATHREWLTGLTVLDTTVIGDSAGLPVRVLDRPSFGGVVRLKNLWRAVEGGDVGAEEWEVAVEAAVAWGDPASSAWPVGQAVGFAEAFRRRFGTTGAAVRGLLTESDRAARLAGECPPLAAGGPLAVSHGTEFPIVQGPMTRVSDTPGFALAVAEAGALPLVALAVLKGAQARPILEATSALLGDRSWGVGILGFVPPDLKHEQIAEVIRARPGFALVAGGRPDEAAPLEAAGIATYLHVPAPSLLRRFLNQGARRFVFEGRECGGHVGPLCSFPLWEAMIEVLLATPDPVEGIHVLFAGGIHDQRSGAIVSAMAAPLAARGIKVGVLMGTAYLFTEEAVTSGAITARYQAEAIACRQTVLLTSGLGHANRVADAGFAVEFGRRRAVLLRSGRAPEEIRDELEQLTLGRLRLASKGIMRDEAHALVQATDEAQAIGGIFMLGQVAALRAKACRMVDLHREVAGQIRPLVRASRPEPAPTEVAIVGLAMLVPGASDTDRFWRNALDLVNCISELPASRWDASLLFDADKEARDRTYSRWGGFCDDIAFDPLSYRIPPAAMAQICANQLLGLELTRRALADAGYPARPIDRERTAVIFGISETGGWNGNRLIARSLLPYLLDHPSPEVEARLPEWTGESFTGMLANITAGRIANVFDLGGPNFVLDAACASSLVAVDLAVRELESGRSRVAIVGAADTSQTPFSYMAFSKTQALSPTGQARVFDTTADGIVLSEGSVVVVLKRLDDARRDGDRVYAVIRGTAASSDGHGLGLTAPKVDGQRRTMLRALTAAAVDPTTVGLYEAHATGTSLGDRTEAETINGVLRDAGAEPAQAVVGSVKSLIGHTKAVAGLVGMAKCSLALRHRVLPPHAGVTRPVDTLAQTESPLSLLQAPRPWLAGGDAPRRAGVSAFGFGGTNGMVLLEEAPDGLAVAPGAALWPAELFLFAADSVDALADRLAALRAALEAGAEPRARDLAYALAVEHERAAAGPRAAIVAASLSELRERLAGTARVLRGDSGPLPLQVSLDTGADPVEGGLAFMFPGQGSQYPGMAREHALYFDEMRDALAQADGLMPPGQGRLSDLIYPAGAFGPGAAERQQAALAATDRAQPAIGAISIGLADLLGRVGIEPHAVGGHSYGELVALHMAGAMSRVELLRLSVLRGQVMARCDQGGMVSVSASRDDVERVVGGMDGVTVANHNGPLQTVLSGPTSALSAASAALASAGLRAVRLPVSGAFHSPLMESAAAPWRDALAERAWRAPECPVYGNGDGTPYGSDPTEIAERLGRHLLASVEFVTQVERMYADGLRAFVEVGPGQIVSKLVSAILGDRPHLAVAVDPSGGRLAGLLAALGTLWVKGRVPHPSRLFDDRDVRPLALDALDSTRPAPPTPSTWWVNPLFARPHVPATTAAQAPMLTSATRALTSPPAAASSPAGLGPTQPALPATGMSADALAAYAEYQATMRKFLELQERVMTGLLAGAPPGQTAPLPATPATVVLPPVRTAPTTDPVAERHPAREASVPAAAPPAPLDAEAIHALLVGAASTETGYPPDMLGRDLDLAGDLGVDSLRQVQIVTAVTESLPADLRDRVSTRMEELLGARTLGAIADVLVSALEPVRGGALPAAAPRPAGHERIAVDVNVATAACPRTAPRGRARPLELPAAPRRWQHVVITEDTMGVSGRAREVLEAAGTRVTLVPKSALDRSDAVAMAVREPADVDAVLHLAGLTPAPPGGVAAESSARLQIDAKSLLYLLRALPPAATPRVVSASLLGGCFGRDGQVGPGSVLAGAGVGVLRSFALERPGARVKAVDLAGGDDAEAMAGRLLQELGADDDAIEIGYRAFGRVVFLNESAPLGDDPSPDAVQPASDWVMLATGGARGITAEVVRALARPGMTIVLAGLRALPPPEPPATAGLPEPDLRRHLVEQSRAGGGTGTPAAIEAQVQGLLRDREIRHTIESLTAIGARVRYQACDVRDDAALASLIEDVYAREGRLSCVLHGAGLIDDHLLADKTDESIDRVVDTKARSALTLARVLRPDGLQLVVFFASVAGRAGSAGQLDYAGANEVLNRLAWRLSADWPETRVLSINWGPWTGTGMASHAVQKKLRERGMVPITPEQGRAFVLEELARGLRTDVEVIAGAGPWEVGDAAAAVSPAGQAAGLRISSA